VPSALQEPLAQLVARAAAVPPVHGWP